MGVVQLVLPCIANVWNSSMLGNFCTSTFIPNGFSLMSDDACHATSSASKFKLHGTYMNSTCSSSPAS